MDSNPDFRASAVPVTVVRKGRGGREGGREGGRAAEANEGIQGNSGGGIGGAAAPVLTKRMNEGRNGLWTKFVLQC